MARPGGARGLKRRHRTQDLDAEQPIRIAVDARHQGFIARDPNFARVCALVSGRSIDRVQTALEGVFSAIDCDYQTGEVLLD